MEVHRRSLLPPPPLGACLSPRTLEVTLWPREPVRETNTSISSLRFQVTPAAYACACTHQGAAHSPAHHSHKFCISSLFLRAQAHTLLTYILRTWLAHAHRLSRKQMRIVALLVLPFSSKDSDPLRVWLVPVICCPVVLGGRPMGHE